MHDTPPRKFDLVQMHSINLQYKPHLPNMNSLTKFEANWSTDAQDSA